MSQRRLSSKDTDLIDRIAGEWRAALPEFDAELITLAIRLITAGRRLEQSAARASKDYKLDYTAMDVLSTLLRRGPPYAITPSALLEEVMITSGALTTCLGRLVERGFITRGRHPDDGRLKTVILTAEGLEVAKTAYTARVDALTEELAGVSQEDRAILNRQLKFLLYEMDMTS